MPTLGPRRNTAPGRDSPSLLVIFAVSLMKPRRVAPKRSMAWILRERRVYGEEWNSWAGFFCWRERLFWSLVSQP
jgi:hypothetical protein